jgi:undecaprenyl-diphosphatase
MERIAREEPIAVPGSKELRRPRDVRFWIAIAILLLGSGAFAFIASLVAHDAPILKQDLQVSVWLHTHGSALFTALLLAITQLHSPLGVSAMVAIVAALLWKRHDYYWLLSLALAVPGGMLLNNLVKHLFQRARPVWEDPILTLASHSFPSGHTAGATLFYGFLAAYVAWRVKSSNAARALFVVVAIVMVSLVGFSRIYLGAHYLSDVLAAVSLAMVWLVICLVGVRALARSTPIQAWIPTMAAWRGSGTRSRKPAPTCTSSRAAARTSPPRSRRKPRAAPSSSRRAATARSAPSLPSSRARTRRSACFRWARSTISRRTSASRSDSTRPWRASSRATPSRSTWPR